ncbi:MAG: YHS domain-containing protein [Anaerolineae bacterium]
MSTSQMTRSPCTHVGHGVRITLDWDYHRLAHIADQAIADLTAPHPRVTTLYTRLLADPQTLALWDLTGYMAVEKLGYNDHGQMHAQVVAANALRLLHLLACTEPFDLAQDRRSRSKGTDIEPDIVTSGAGTLEDAFLVVLAAALLHDVGNQVAREGHESYSVLLAQPVLARHLPDLYSDPAQLQVLTSFILSAIASHDCCPSPVTLEGAIVAVADGADMTQGRGQVAFDRGRADIHAVSAMAIREVTIRAGEETPVHIEVAMDNPAGLFQVERMLGRKLALSGLDRYVSLRACVASEEAEQAFHCLVLRDGRLEPETMPAPMDTAWSVDPVCGMAVAPEQAADSVLFQGIRYHFCSSACLTYFRDDPSRYLQGERP